MRGRSGGDQPGPAADALLTAGVELAIVKQGPRGVLGKTRIERVVVPPAPVDVVNGLGAGDAFGGSLCHGSLTDLPTAAEVKAHVAAHPTPRPADTRV